MRTIVALPLLMTAAAAYAADLPPPPVYAPPPLVQAKPVWAGFYVGGNIGGGWADSPTNFSTTGALAGSFGSANNYLSGITGGVQVGYNWQSGPFVYGGETDFQFNSIDGSLSATCLVTLCGVPLSAHYEQKVPWFGTVRGRIGYAQDSWLIYATGGYAYARLQTDASATANGTTGHFTEDTTRNGWTVGGGIEVALTPNWSVKAEYLYTDFGSTTTTWAVPGLPRLTDETSLNMNTVRTGVNYRF